MKRMPSAREIVRFPLAATPAIWLTLFAIQQVSPPIPPVPLYPAHHATSTSQYSVEVISIPPGTLGEKWSINTLLPVTPGLNYCFKTIDSKDATVEKVGLEPDTQRRIVFIMMENVNKQFVDANIRAVTKEIFENGAIWTHIAPFDVHKGLKEPVATLTFAPYGDWGSSTTWTNTRRSSSTVNLLPFALNHDRIRWQLTAPSRTFRG